MKALTILLATTLFSGLALADSADGMKTVSEKDMAAYKKATTQLLKIEEKFINCQVVQGQAELLGFNIANIASAIAEIENATEIKVAPEGQQPTLAFVAPMLVSYSGQANPAAGLSGYNNPYQVSGYQTGFAGYQTGYVNLNSGLPSQAPQIAPTQIGVFKVTISTMADDQIIKTVDLEYQEMGEINTGTIRNPVISTGLVTEFAVRCVLDQAKLGAISSQTP